MSFVSLLLITLFLLGFALGSAKVSFVDLRDNGNYTCDELTRWLGTEKHYSNDKKEILFQLHPNQNCEKQPSFSLENIAYGWANGGRRTFFRIQDSSSLQKCSVDDYVVAYLSNFSINNNFSHFLHGLLRLFCALIDADLLVWNEKTQKFQQTKEYTIWLDEYFKLNEMKLVWIKSLGLNIRSLRDVTKGNCVVAKKLVYGSGCVRLLPPEKWFGYPGCRAKEMLPAFGHYMRSQFMASTQEDLMVVDEESDTLHGGRNLRIAFAVRDVGPVTGRRSISNLQEVQSLLISTQHVRASTENITFEHLDVPSTIRYMAGVHIFISVHGAGMTNMFFMNPGTAVVEIIPYPLCNCRSPDYFYGVGGYYHGSSIAQGIKHYPYCVPPEDMVWHTIPKDLKTGGKCSWRHLHAVESVRLDTARFVSLLRNVERDLIVSGTIVLTKPIINMSPHANG